MTERTLKERMAGPAFGLPAEQLRYFEELTEAQRAEVEKKFSLHRAEEYMYAVKRDDGLVWKREPLRYPWWS